GASGSNSKSSKSSGGKPRRPVPVGPRRASQASGPSSRSPAMVDGGMTVSKPRATVPEIPSLKVDEAGAEAEGAAEAPRSRLGLTIGLGVLGLALLGGAAAIVMRHPAPEPVVDVKPVETV